MSRAGDLGDYGVETNLWVAVIDKGIRDATDKVGRWDFDQHRRDKAREFFGNGSCTDILKAIDVDPAWFLGKLRLRHPGIFESAREGQG